MPGKVAGCCGTSAIPVASSSCGPADVMSLPSNSTEPWLTSISPYSALKTVDLPEPFGPTTHTISPSATDRSTPCRMSTSRYPVCSPSTSSRGQIDISVYRSACAGSEVGTDDLLIGLDLVRRALGEHPAPLQHHDPVGHAEHEPPVVLDDHERH